jgi:hypothetical protein
MVMPISIFVVTFIPLIFIAVFIDFFFDTLIFVIYFTTLSVSQESAQCREAGRVTNQEWVGI